MSFTCSFSKEITQEWSTYWQYDASRSNGSCHCGWRDPDWGLSSWQLTQAEDSAIYPRETPMNWKGAVSGCQCPVLHHKACVHMLTHTNTHSMKLLCYPAIKYLNVTLWTVPNIANESLRLTWVSTQKSTTIVIINCDFPTITCFLALFLPLYYSSEDRGLLWGLKETCKSASPQYFWKATPPATYRLLLFSNACYVILQK